MNEKHVTPAGLAARSGRVGVLEVGGPLLSSLLLESPYSSTGHGRLSTERIQPHTPVPAACVALLIVPLMIPSNSLRPPKVMRFYPSFSPNSIGANNDMTLLHMAARANKVSAETACVVVWLSFEHRHNDKAFSHPSSLTSQNLAVRWLLRAGADPAARTRDEQLAEDLTTDIVRCDEVPFFFLLQDPTIRAAGTTFKLSILPWP